MTTIPTDQILPVFFAAMQNGYAGGATKSTISELPSSKVIRYKHDDFEVVDCYFTTPHSYYSFGTTTIYYRGNAVWMMQYRGQYPKDIISFLKRALRQTYEKSEFVGGRGPKGYVEGKKGDERSFYDESGSGGLWYQNSVPSNCDWRRFSGNEQVYHVDYRGTNLKGWHEYDGLLLV